METRPPFAKPPVIIKPFEAVPPGILRPPENKPTSILPLVMILGCASMLIVGWGIYSAAIVVDTSMLLLAGLALFWMTGSAGVARSAKKKGRSAIAFFVLSMVFSWCLMALIVACMRRARRLHVV
jgi:hypothetical protein